MKKLFLILVSAIFIISCVSSSFAIDVAKNPTFSFASDSCAQGPTFYGSGNGIYSYDTKVDLIFDLNNDNEAGLVAFSALMKCSMVPYNHRVYQPNPLASRYVHVWEVKANDFFFYHLNLPLTPPLMQIKFEHALLTSWSTSPQYIGKTMTLQASEKVELGPTLSMTPFPLLNGIGIMPESLQRYEDLAFTFTNIRPKGAPGDFVHLDASGMFVEDWESEGSFSASGCIDIPLP